MSFEASSSPAFGQQSSAFGAFSTPALGGSSTQRSPFGGASGTSVLGQKPACGIFWPSPAQTNLLGRTAQPLQPAFGSNMFGTTSPFGESKPAFGINTTPAFGSTNISAFGSSASPFGGTSIPAFGAPSTPTFSSTPSPAFGSRGSAFGTTSSNLFETGGSFGVTSAAFGQSRSAFGATTSAPAWCQSSPSFGFSSSAPAFGQSSSSSGAQSTTLGNTALGQSPSVGQQGGSRETSYTGTAEPDSNGMAILESISAMTAYKEKIHEELRWEDYQLGDKGGPSPAGGGGFGMSTVQTNPLNPTPATPFAQMSSSPFNASTSSSLFAPKTSTSPTSFSFSTLATSSTPSFNFPTPSNPQTQSAQTGTTSFQMNPSTLGSNLFNNTSSLQSSSLGTTSNQLAPSSGTTSTSTYGHTPFASPFVVPFQASQPSQTSTSIFNTINSFDQIQPGNRGGFGSSLFERSQNNSGPWLGSACPATNPFNLLHRPGQLPFGHAASSPSVQNGISGSLTATRDLIESFRNQSDVALRITKELLLTKGKDKNMVYSPLSIHVVLSLIAAGSTKGHPLHDEMLKFLKSRSIEQLNELASNLVPLVFADGTPSGGPSLSFSNGVWVETSLPVKASFKEVLDNAYKAVLKQVDFRTRPEEARCEVNSWVEKVTRGLIKDLLPHGTVNCTTRVILANALYFKGAWDQKFVESRTNMFDFHLLSGKSVKAPFMTSWKDQFISVFDGFKVLKLPYKQGEDHNRRFSMYMFLPNASNGLSSLVERVCSEAGFLDRYLPCRKVEVDKFLIPKFKITFDIEVSEVLETLGLKLPCLSETVVGAELVVNLIIHKSYIEVNEEGTEAAAATATAVMFGCAAPRPAIEKIDFVADHPFLFLIREEATGAVMFVGHVLDPIAE
ncbi:hypothetical protein ACLB2K_049273 [Fragaria x ananassa]